MKVCPSCGRKSRRSHRTCPGCGQSMGIDSSTILVALFLVLLAVGVVLILRAVEFRWWQRPPS